MRSPYEIGVSCFLCSVPVFQSAHGNPPPRFSHAGAMDQPVLIAAEILFMSKKNRYDQTHHSADQVSGDQNEISSVHYGACGVSREWPVDRAIYGKRRRGLQSGAKRALLADKNEYIIAFYQGIQNGTITTSVVREFLEYHGSLLQQYGEAYYREMRDAFNENGDPLYFLFLNRSDFNGMIRFNRHGKFNVPFCQKPNRFSKSYITKICNQVTRISQIMRGKDWQFVCAPWQESFLFATEADYIYLDPPTWEETPHM